jgi:hypothetical protein
MRSFCFLEPARCTPFRMRPSSSGAFIQMSGKGATALRPYFAFCPMANANGGTGFLSGKPGRYGLRQHHRTGGPPSFSSLQNSIERSSKVRRLGGPAARLRQRRGLLLPGDAVPFGILDPTGMAPQPDLETETSAHGGNPFGPWAPSAGVTG